MHIGIDLGTTFCCVSYIDEDGSAHVILNDEGEKTTPSVVWFNGKEAYIGSKANARKLMPGQEAMIYEFIKRNIGKPIEASPDYPEETTKPYLIDGFKYGAVGMSALILRKLKRDAIRYLRNKNKLAASVEEKSYQLDAVISVPAYFTDLENNETQLAGFVAGLNVLELIKEPCAAALTYPLSHGKDSQLIFVFDLGGGTFDITLLRRNNDTDEAFGHDGATNLGGKDFDALIEEYIADQFYKKTGQFIPPEKKFDLQRIALAAKLALTDNKETTIYFSCEAGEIELTLYREVPPNDDPFAMDENRPFYFEERANDLVTRCQAMCQRLIEEKGKTWNDIDEIVLAGGSCRMPMIPKMLEALTGKKILRQISGFSLDTAISIGASIKGSGKRSLKDVASHTIGVKYKSRSDGIEYIEPLIKKSSPLPAVASRTFPAETRAVLEIYEGEERKPDECRRRGQLQLDNPAGTVTVTLDADASGVISIHAQYPPDNVKYPVPLVAEGFDYSDTRRMALREKVQAVRIN